MVPLRLGRQLESSYVTVGSAQLSTSFLRGADTRTRGRVKPWCVSAAPISDGLVSGSKPGESPGDGNAASATDLLRQPATVTHCLRTSFSGPSRTKGQRRRLGRQAAQAYQPQCPCWLAACPRITHPLWSHFPQLRNRYNDSTYPEGCLEN